MTETTSVSDAQPSTQERHITKMQDNMTPLKKYKDLVKDSKRNKLMKCLIMNKNVIVKIVKHCKKNGRGYGGMV